jgi:hypothetical protein
MRRVLLPLGAGIVIVLLVLSQLLLPRFVDRQVEDRLTKDGGSADVTVKALPALTLLAHSGSEAKVRGSGLTLDLTLAGDRPLHELDGFRKVDIELRSSTAGPFRVSRLVLRRGSRDEPYATALDATVTGRELAAFAGRTLAGPFGDFLGGLAAGAVPYADSTIPVHVRATIGSDDGRPRVAAATGTLAGLPAGPLLQALAVAVAQRF